MRMFVLNCIIRQKVVRAKLKYHVVQYSYKARWNIGQEVFLFVEFRISIPVIPRKMRRSILMRELGSLSVRLCFAKGGQKAFSAPHCSLAYAFSLSCAFSIKLGESCQGGKSIITKRGVMTQMAKSRSLYRDLFCLRGCTCLNLIYIQSFRQKRANHRYYPSKL